MGKAALYRRYRSQTFKDVVGQEHVTDLLAEAVARDAISHAYLFTGPRGVGKTSVARILAHAVNKLPYSTDTHLDIIEIDAASNRRIDDIRDLREKVHIAPVSAIYKVYIIDEVHMLTGESFNALLKTLEEPPTHVIFILATTEIQKVPATIISRTQRFQFRPGSPEAVVGHLKSIAKQENISIDDEALERIAAHGDGSFRDSVGLLDQIASSANGKITATHVDTLLGLVPLEQLTELVSSIEAHDIASSTALLKKIRNDGLASTIVAGQLARYVAAHAVTHDDFGLIEQLLEVPKSASPDLKLLTVVARAATPKEDNKHRAAKAVVESIPTPVLEKSVPSESTMPSKKPVEPSKKPKVEAIQEKPQPVTPSVATIVASSSNQEFDWDQVMTQIAKRHPPLFSVLKRANMSRGDDGALILEFAYKLHQKKLEDAKYRTLLISLVTDLFGSCPQLIIRLRAQGAPKNEVAAEVAAIMGGGEEVNAK
jgi:DNA polymerase III subunit gamma/tau